MAFTYFPPSRWIIPSNPILHTHCGLLRNRRLGGWAPGMWDEDYKEVGDVLSHSVHQAPAPGKKWERWEAATSGCDSPRVLTIVSCPSCFLSWPTQTDTRGYMPLKARGCQLRRRGSTFTACDLRDGRPLPALRFCAKILNSAAFYHRYSRVYKDLYYNEFEMRQWGGRVQTWVLGSNIPEVFVKHSGITGIFMHSPPPTASAVTGWISGLFIPHNSSGYFLFEWQLSRPCRGITDAMFDRWCATLQVYEPLLSLLGLSASLCYKLITLFQTGAGILHTVYGLSDLEYQ